MNPHTFHIATYGGGVNTVAMLILLTRQGVRLDHILFSDTRGEKDETYQYIEYFNPWLLEHSQPAVTHLTPYREEGLYGECVRLKRLPSIAYGFKSCSEKWKLRPYKAFCKANDLYPQVKYKGYDAGEGARLTPRNDAGTTEAYPLIEADLDRFDCIRLIIDAGLRVPPKSSCFFCPSMKQPEIHRLHKTAPAKMALALALEENAQAGLTSLRGLKREKRWSEIITMPEIDFACDDDFDSLPCDCKL